MFITYDLKFYISYFFTCLVLERYFLLGCVPSWTYEKAVQQNRSFSERKGVAYLYKLENQTIKLAVLSQKIAQLTEAFEN